jgi:16S rRNA (guanine(527)-N(7))-methyltransferase RsmG
LEGFHSLGDGERNCDIASDAGTRPRHSIESGVLANTGEEIQTMEDAYGLRELMGRYGFAGEAPETQRMIGFLALLEKWNRKMNLTASTAWPAISWLFEEALWGGQWYPAGDVRHLDIGSGAGFPAIPMRILRPEMQLTMVESRTKRVAFLETVAVTVGLPGTEAACARIEEFLRREPDRRWDIVSWKGVKLSREAFALILERVGAEAQFWLFHGEALPFEEPEAALGGLRLVRRENFPGDRTRLLSIFSVSRETCST